MVAQMKLEDQENDLFSLTKNKELKCYDLVLKKSSYNTSAELANLLSWIHQVGVNMPKVQLRIGARIESPIIQQPSIITNVN